MTENRFRVYKVIGSFHKWCIEDKITDKVVFGSIIHKYEADRLCEKLNELNDENEQLENELTRLEILNEKLKNEDYTNLITELRKRTEENMQLKETIKDYSDANARLEEENEQLKQEKPFLKIHNDYFIQYGDDRELFSMHKPSDIRSLMYLINRENGYSELQSQYNNLEMVE